MIVRIENLTKRYGQQTVLEDVHFQLEKGRSAAIVGPSGSGKTTFLNILGTLDTADSGTVLFDGRDVARWSEKERAAFRNLHIGFVFQMHYLLPQCSVLENVLIPTLTLKDKRLKADAVQRAEALLDRLGLMDHRHKLPGQLSGGECQRTAFVRALINQPELILADEPTGSLDEENAARLAQELIQLNRELNTSLIVVTHSDRIASQMDSTWRFSHHRLTTD